MQECNAKATLPLNRPFAVILKLPKIFHWIEMLISLFCSPPPSISLSGNLALYNSSSIRQQARAAVDALHRCGKPFRFYSLKLFLRFIGLLFSFNYYMYTCNIDSSTYSNSDYQRQQTRCKNNIHSEIASKFTNIYTEKASNIELNVPF